MYIRTQGSFQDYSKFISKLQSAHPRVDCDFLVPAACVLCVEEGCTAIGLILREVHRVYVCALYISSLLAVELND